MPYSRPLGHLDLSPSRQADRDNLRIRNRLEDARRQRDDTRLRPLIQRARNAIGCSNVAMAAKVGIPASTFEKWMAGLVLPTKYLPVVDAWLLAESRT